MFRFIYVIVANVFRAPYMIPRMRRMAKHPEKYSEEQRYQLANHMIHLMQRSGRISTICTGSENLPEEGGYIMYPNHQGKYDALGIISVHRKPCTLVMDRNKSNSLLVKEFIDLLDGKRMDIKDIRQAMKIILEVSKEAADGKRFILFPEGGYDRNQNQVEDFKAGSFKSAMKAKVPIVPVALIDSYKVFNTFGFKKITTQVHFLKPIFYEEYQGMKTQEIASLVKQRIKDVIEEKLQHSKNRMVIS
ncbi:MAG: 1-acyl-sn-glycerol-3-phosphate acyltransferase [Lachnospiraceae bacterium]|jgi:1-acyl-sn-glycerol-3-phosphate acyltransferase|nr:1-acyl-sn-glycerol-3-phosphate acyltransferase [Lachnospiraceae bacterium]